MLWVSGGQLISALGMLVSVRLLTEYLMPEVFGEVILIVGAAALFTTLISNPILQALLRYYPDHSEKQNTQLLLGVVSSSLGRMVIIFVVIAIPIGCGLYWYWNKPITYVFLLVALVVVETIKNYEFAILNAVKNQVLYAIWFASEAWLRPLIVVLLAVSFDANVANVLLAYILASILIFLVVQSKNPSRVVDRYRFSIPKDSEVSALLKSIKTYSIPLLPLALIGWLSGLGDRYLIGSLMSFADAGIYAAVYGLMSQPFLLAGRVFELTFRPNFQQAISTKNYNNAKKIFIVWFLGTISVVALGCTLIYFFQNEIAWLLLGKEFRVGRELMVWIALGYVFLVLSYVFERVCYACDKTKYILTIQCFGIVVGMAAIAYGISQKGLLGAAMAVPIYFGFQLLISIILANKAYKEITQ